MGRGKKKKKKKLCASSWTQPIQKPERQRDVPTGPMGEQEFSKWTNSLQDLGQKEHFKLHLNVTSSQGSNLKKLSEQNWYFSFVLHFLALVNIFLQNTKQDGATQKCIMRTKTEISAKKMIQREGVTIGVQINSYTEAVLQQPVQISYSQRFTCSPYSKW